MKKFENQKQIETQTMNCTKKTIEKYILDTLTSYKIFQNKICFSKTLSKIK